MMLWEWHCEHYAVRMMMWEILFEKEVMKKTLLERRCEKNIVRKTLWEKPLNVVRKTLWEKCCEKNVVRKTLFNGFKTTQYAVFMLYIKTYKFTDCWRSVGVCALDDGLFIIELVRVRSFERKVIETWLWAQWKPLICRCAFWQFRPDSATGNWRWQFRPDSAT